MARSSIGRPRGDGQNFRDSLRAKAFELVDDSGRTRIMLSTVDEDAFLGIVDKLGKLVAAFGTKGDEVSLRLGDVNGSPRAALTLSGDMPSLELTDRRANAERFCCRRGPTQVSL